MFGYCEQTGNWRTTISSFQLDMECVDERAYFGGGNAGPLRRKIQACSKGGLGFPAIIFPTGKFLRGVRHQGRSVDWCLPWLYYVDVSIPITRKSTGLSLRKTIDEIGNST